MGNFKPDLEPLESREMLAVLPAPPSFLNVSVATFTESPSLRINAKGVIETKYPPAYTPDLWAISPLNVSRYIVALYGEWLVDSDPAKLQAITVNAQWLVDNTVAKPLASGSSVFVIPYTFGISSFQIPPGFVSGLSAAAETVALFVAARATGNSEWEAKAYDLTYIFDQTVANWGVRVRTSAANPIHAFYEEYAHPSRAGQTPLVLNGHLYAITWIYWYYREGNFSDSARQRMRNLFEAGRASVRDRIHLYNEPSLTMSVYDLMIRNRSQAYHDAHVILLDNLHVITAEPNYLTWANAWRGRKF